MKNRGFHLKKRVFRWPKRGLDFFGCLRKQRLLPKLRWLHHAAVQPSSSQLCTEPLRSWEKPKTPTQTNAKKKVFYTGLSESLQIPNTIPFEWFLSGPSPIKPPLVNHPFGPSFGKPKKHVNRSVPQAAFPGEIRF